MGVTKIRTEKSEDSGLIAELRSKISCPERLRLVWHTHQDAEEIDPGNETVGIAVDMRKDKAAIRIFEKTSDEYIDGVGTEEQGWVVVVPWRTTWVYLCTGTPRVGHILSN